VWLALVNNWETSDVIQNNLNDAAISNRVYGESGLQYPY
jgi:hypothetical protein